MARHVVVDLGHSWRRDLSFGHGQLAMVLHPSVRRRVSLKMGEVLHLGLRVKGEGRDDVFLSQLRPFNVIKVSYRT